MSLPHAQAPLTRRGIPLERDLRVLALGSFANRFGAGAVMTTSALYFTRQVGFSAAEVALALAVAAVVGILVQVPAERSKRVSSARSSASCHGVRARTGSALVRAAPTMQIVSTRRGPWLSPSWPAGTWTRIPTTAATASARATSAALKPTCRVK